MLIQYTIRSTIFLLGLVASLSAFAAAVIESAAGQVRVGASVSTAAAASTGQRIEAGSTVVTGPGARATLRFDDGQYVLLHENTQFRVAEYAYAKEAPAKDKFVFELLRGALRMVTAAVKPRNPSAYLVRTPVATIGIRGTDFMLAEVNPLYISVLHGTVLATNTGGTLTLVAGSTGFVANAATLGALISAGALPASVSAAFSQLSSIALSVGGAVGATGAAAGGALAPEAIAIGAAVAAGVAAAVGGGEAATGTTGTTGTQ